MDRREINRALAKAVCGREKQGRKVNFGSPWWLWRTVAAQVVGLSLRSNLVPQPTPAPFAGSASKEAL